MKYNIFLLYYVFNIFVQMFLILIQSKLFTLLALTRGKIVLLAKVVHLATKVVFIMNSFIACTFSFKYEQVVMKCQTEYNSAILMQILFLCIKTIASAYITRKDYRKGKTHFRSYLQLKLCVRLPYFIVLSSIQANIISLLHISWGKKFSHDFCQ